MKRIALAAAATALFFGASHAAEDRVLTLPSDYKQTFTHYYSGDRLFAEKQTIKLYANEVARAAAVKGERLPSGSVLVGELFGAKTDADGEIIESTLGRRIHGEQKAIVVMERRDGWDDQYPDELKVGDWEFEVFSAAGENLNKDTTACRECHHPLSDSDFLFSIEHMASAVK